MENSKHRNCHQKAKAYQSKTDPEKDFLHTVRLHFCDMSRSSMSVKEIIRSLTRSFAHYEPHEIINFLEGVYDAFDPHSNHEESKIVMQLVKEKYRSEYPTFTEKDRNQLFQEAFDIMLRSAKAFGRETVLKALKKYYPELEQ